MADWKSMERLSGAPMDVVNPNGLAFIILTILPFLHYISAGGIVRGLLYLSLLPPLVYALVLTASRSGMLGFAAIAALVIARSRHKVVLSAALVIAAVVVAPLLSDNLADRYMSIFSTNTKNSVTATGRTDTLKDDLQVAMRRPLFGHGLGTSREANANFGTHDQPSHNLYTETLEELGFAGLILVVIFIVSLVRQVLAVSASARQGVPQGGFVSSVAEGLLVWLGMNLLFSFASYGVSGFEWYFAAGLADVLPAHLAQVPATANQAQAVVPVAFRRPALLPRPEKAL
jgi:O-antigen ligase